jgi:hypothetical protein
MIASSRVLGLCGGPYYTQKHGYLIDGGFTDAELLSAMVFGTKFCSFHNGPGTSVCPFYCSRADVRPRRYINILWAVWPPTPEELRGVFECASRAILHVI